MGLARPAARAEAEMARAKKVFMLMVEMLVVVVVFLVEDSVEMMLIDGFARLFIKEVDR